MVQLKQGESLHVECQFTYQGTGYSGAKIHAAIGVQGTLQFDEVLAAEVDVGPLASSPTPTPFTLGFDILITEAIAPGLYEFYAKLMSIPGADLFDFGPQDDIEILASHNFSDFTAAYTKA